MVVLLISLNAAARCEAKNNCPYLNEATASDFVGADAVGEFTDATTAEPAACVFTAKDQNATRLLRITVQPNTDGAAAFHRAAQTCTADASPMQAIGNEAVMCAADSAKGVLGERVIGRVRDQIFTITLSTSLKADSVFTRDALRSKIAVAAEQVSGNLF